jgi:hypothetical protein
MLWFEGCLLINYLFKTFSLFVPKPSNILIKHLVKGFILSIRHGKITHAFITAFDRLVHVVAPPPAILSVNATGPEVGAAKLLVTPGEGVLGVK